MDSSIFRFALRHSWRHQIALALLIAASYPVIYISLELPKAIVDGAIAGIGTFPKEVAGWQLDQIAFLMLLSFLFLGVVIINGLFKYVINTFKGRLNERMLRRLRFELYSRMLRFPIAQFRKVSGGEIIPMITAETDPIGNFIGESIATPLQQGGMLLVYLTFIFLQDPILGAAAVALYPFQGWLIPRLQRRVNLLSKERVRLTRGLSDRIGESASSINEIRSNDAADWHRSDLSRRLGEIYEVRFKIYQRKFFIKFLNNFINQLTPFFFYSIGGYLVITGSITFGALVAVLAAYKDLAGPWKELLDWYQLKEDVRIKYEQVVEQFDVDGLVAENGDAGSGLHDPVLTGDVIATQVGQFDDLGNRTLDGVSFHLPAGQHAAIVGAGSASGASELASVLAGLNVPSLGRLQIGELDMATLPAGVSGRRIGYAGVDSRIVTGSLRDNLLYGLKRRPLEPPREPGYRPSSSDRNRRREAMLTGNLDVDPSADWIDYAAAGCKDSNELDDRILYLLERLDLADDAYGLGLHGTLDPSVAPDAAERILIARREFRDELSEGRIDQYVEPFDRGRYNTNASVAENLLFGTPVGSAFQLDRLASHPYVHRIISLSCLADEMLSMGLKVAETMVELFANIARGHEFFERFSFISSDDLPTFQAILQRVSRDGRRGLTPADRDLLMQLPFKLIPSRHRLGLIDGAFMVRLMEARRMFAQDLPAELRASVEFYDPHRYNAAASLIDNVLFGKVAHGQPHVHQKVHGLLASVIERLDLRSVVTKVGLDMPIGVAGARLSATQRQKVVLARCLLKRPDVLVINAATAALDGASQAVIHTTVLEESAGRTLFWIVHRPSLARLFDMVLVLEDGQLVESGTFDELSRPGTVLAGLLSLES